MKADRQLKDKYININTISDQIDDCINQFLANNGIDTDYKSITSVKHSTVNYMLSYIYKSLFKPNKTLINNQKSLVNYNDSDLMEILAVKFIEICQRFNKSLGLMSFCYMIGCDYSSIFKWLQDEKLNPVRFKALKYIQESHKAQQIALLNDSPVGALAVANNDVETGLEWSTKQLTLAANNPVFLIPSERLERLKLSAPTDQQERQPVE